AYSNRVAAAIENHIVREIEGIVDKAVRLLKAAPDLACDAHASANAEVHQWAAGENAEARIESRNVFESDVHVAREADPEIIDSGITHEPRLPDGQEIIAACSVQVIPLDETASV